MAGRRFTFKPSARHRATARRHPADAAEGALARAASAADALREPRSIRTSRGRDRPARRQTSGSPRLVGDRAPLGSGDQPCELRQHARRVARLGQLPLLATARQLGGVDHARRATCCGRRSTMRSPSRTNAIGPPSTASGATWPMQKPHVPPENRPSVTSAQSAPRPAPFSAPVTASISRMPGPPFGPS